MTKPEEDDGRLLDTNIACGWQRGDPVIVQRIEALPPDTSLFISSITLGEIEFGHACAGTGDPEKQAELRRWLKERFPEELELPITRSTGMYYGEFKSKLYDAFHKDGKTAKKKRRPEACIDATTGQTLGIDENDLWIVSQAAERGLILVTNDKMVRIKQVVGSRVRIELWPV